MTRVGILSVHTSPLEQAGSGDSGGMNVSIRALGRELVQRGVAVDVFTRATGEDLPPVVSVDGVRVHHLPAGPPWLSKSDLANHLCAFFLSLARHPVTPRLDLLHAHYWMSGWVGRQAKHRLDLPFVQSFHTLGKVKNAALAPGDQPEPALRLAAEERIVADADAVIAPTRAEADVLERLYGAPRERVRLVEPGVDLDIFHPDPDATPPRHELGSGPLLLFVGRLQPLKAPELAVHTLAALSERVANLRLVVVGGPSGGRGTDPTGLRALAARLGVGDRLAILAPRPHRELAALYRAADVVLVPSHTESFGLVALEAMASGTPVVAARVGGLVHLLSEGGGALVAERSVEAYAAAVLPYVTDRAVRDSAGAIGRRRARSYSWQRTAEETLAVYDDVLAGRLVPVHGQFRDYDVQGA